MGKRRASRELALKFLYQFDLNKGGFDDEVKQFLERSFGKDDVKNFAADLIANTIQHKNEIDDLLEKCSDNWALSRMAVIDRNILRLAACELFYCKNIPHKVVIDEAVEIAKKYGGEDSPEFINGILDRIKNDIRKEISPTPT